MNKKLIYFDNAATGYPKPESVRRAAFCAFEECGGNPGRSGHILSANASKAVFECREAVCGLLNFGSPERVVFTLNATHALNIAIKGLAEKKSHIIISNLEHNSVYRPVYAFCADKGNEAEFSVFDAYDGSDKNVVENFRREIRSNTKTAVITAASNICGRLLPIKEIGRICRKKGIKLIVDASQALGETEFDMQKLNADVVCSAGHKGLYGPTGTGFAVFSGNIEPEAVFQGGNGLVSESPEMGSVLPEMLEAGTVNTFGICGLCAGIKFISDMGTDYIRGKTGEIERYISDGLEECGAVLYGKCQNKTPIILFNIPNFSPSAVSSYLDDRLICTRSGIHCCPLGHKALGTGEEGAVRVSLGYANTMGEASTFLKEIQKLIKTEGRNLKQI